MAKVEARRASARSRTRSALSATEALAAVVGGRSLRPRRAGSQGAGGAAVGVSIGGGATSNLGPESPLRRSARSGDSAGAARNSLSKANSTTSSTTITTRGRRGNKANNTGTLNRNIRPRRSSINYREDSSDDSDSASTTTPDETDGEEEDHGEQDAQPPRRSTISTRGHPSRTQTQLSTTHSNTRTITSSRQTLGKRRRPQSGFFHEDDSDGEDDVQDDEIVNTDQETLPTPRGGRGSVARARGSSVPRTPERKRRRGTPATDTKRRMPASSRKSKLDLVHSGDVEEDTAEKEPKVIPPWHELPYEIWRLIFKYASAERDRDAVNLLLSACHLCKDLAEPALTALYYSPPLLTRKMAHGLVAFLSSDSSKWLYRYKWKVKKLRIDVAEIASKTYKGQHLDWDALLANVPQLKSIDFYHEKDNAPFRSLEASLRWKYPTALWKFLNGGDPPRSEHEPIQLEAWRWNGRLMTPDMTMQSPAIIHQTPAFSNLKKICLQNFQVPSMPLHNWPTIPEDVRESEGFENFLIGEFAQAINALPQLEWLSIESSTIANDHLLSLLPNTLKTLELVNCWEITADDFSEFLLTRAHNLEHLYLRHNQSLSMSFLTVLGTACPCLQTLSVDLKTYNHHEFYNDSDPSYDEVLSVEEVPDWPVSLRTLELQNMRKWSADAAENLFQSLIKAAPDLPDLRIININAKLNIPIRQRSEMRDRWEARLKGVFLRKWEDPKPPFTLRPPRPPTPKQLMPTFSTSKIPPSATKRSRTDKWVAQSIEADQQGSGSSSQSQSTRRSARIAALSSGPSSNGGTPSPSRGNSFQRGEREMSATSSLCLSAEELSLSPREANVAGEILYRHGWCEKVELQLDNQKLTEQTLTMEDFVDGSGGDDDDEDSEWDGMDRDDDYGGGGYAW